MTSGFQNKTEHAIAVVDEGLIKQFQSLNYLFKGRRDTDIKLFYDYKQFTYSDNIELNAKIYTKLELHEKVKVSLDKNEIRTFGNWHEFTQTDCNISAKTKYTSIEWGFNIILPNQTQKIPETHTLSIRIDNNLKPTEIIQVVFLVSEVFELEEIQSQMVCKIDFVISQKCSELITVICERYYALEKGFSRRDNFKIGFFNLFILQD